MLDADWSPNAVSVHAGTSQVDVEVDCPPPARSTRRSFDHHGKGNGNLYQKSFEEWKEVVSLIDLKEMKTRNDCEIACDSVKRANVVLHVDLCKEIFDRKHTGTHKPTSAQPTHCATMTHIHTYTYKMAGRRGAPRPPMTDIGTETAFRFEKAPAFPKK